MRVLAEVMPARARSRMAIVIVVAAAAAGCSADTTRFASTTFTPQKSAPASNEVTGSVRAAPTSRVESQPLGQTTQLPPPQASRPSTVSSAPQAGGGPGMGTYRPSQASSDVTGSVPASPPPVIAAAPAPAPAPVATRHAAAPAPATQSGWTWDGGTPIVVGSNDTLSTIAHRYGVPAAAIVQANGLSPNTTLQPGQRLVIPRYNSASVVANQRPPVGTPPRGTSAPQAATTHTVGTGDTLTKIATRYGKSVPEVAKANNIEPSAKLSLGDKLVIPGAKASTVATRGAPPAPLQAPAGAQPQRQATAEPQQQARVATPAKDQPAPPAATPQVAEPAGALPGFRWPARGRVIAGFGPKPNGQQNDGINLALPEGTPIKAADDGVVAYSGNELKGYGNLVLIRHANGYVTAYAHASELKVKRGDNVKRGQTLGLVGQTGSVTSPQLHFEIRKGAMPVDPMQFLNGA